MFSSIKNGRTYVLNITHVRGNFITMDSDYILIRKRARQIVEESPLPDFYRDQADANRYSLDFYSQNPIVQKIKAHVAGMMDQNLGHGLHHAEKVSLDAGALLVIICRMQERPEAETERLLLLAHSAGLLHDVMRKKQNHAVEGADYASGYLTAYPFTTPEIIDISEAIRNHEAFKTVGGDLTSDGLIISNCLYDADKFRWGPDNFSHTVWDMVTHAHVPLKVFMSHFPRGLETVGKVRDTFRSDPGKHYGPQFIDIGMAIGNKLYDVIKAEFPFAFS